MIKRIFRNIKCALFHRKHHVKETRVNLERFSLSGGECIKCFRRWINADKAVVENQWVALAINPTTNEKRIFFKYDLLGTVFIHHPVVYEFQNQIPPPGFEWWQEDYLKRQNQDNT